MSAKHATPALPAEPARAAEERARLIDALAAVLVEARREEALLAERRAPGRGRR